MSVRRSEWAGALIAVCLLLAGPTGASAQVVEPGFHGRDFGWGMKQLQEDSLEWQVERNREQLDETMEQKRRRLESERSLAQAKRQPPAERRPD